MASAFASLNLNFVVFVLLPWILIMVEMASCEDQVTPSSDTQSVTVAIDGRSTVARVSPSFLCATIDWWPAEKCDYGACSWGQTSALNLDLSNALLQNAIRGLSPVMLRLGGTLQDKLIYGIGDLKRPCLSQMTRGLGLFGFSEGCLNMSRWDALNQFFQQTGAQVAFGLNALYGREKDHTQPWDSSNAQDFLQYTISKNYQIQAWTLGNELIGSGKDGANVPVTQYISDLKKLRAIIDGLYVGSTTKPLLVSPDGFIDENLYYQLLRGTGNQVLNGCSRHIYSLGTGAETDLVDKILNLSYVNEEASDYRAMEGFLQTYGPWSQAWISEAGGVSNGGRHLVSDAFAFSFWYANQLGMAARFNNAVYCRQTLIGGNYGLLDHTTFQPNPDYYSALLWKNLMGIDVLSATVTGDSHLRAYAHCAKGDPRSVSVLLINLGTMQFNVKLAFDTTTTIIANTQEKTTQTSTKQESVQKSEIDPQRGTKQRLEYHLTADSLESQTVLLNGIPLQMTSTGNLPALNPILRNPSLPIVVSPSSIVFVKLRSPTSACSNIH